MIKDPLSFSTMRVIARVRPLLPQESAQESLDPALLVDDDGQTIYINGDLNASFGPYSNNRR